MFALVARGNFPKPSAKRRAKAVAKTQSLLGIQGTCRMYGFGVTGPDPTRSWWVVLGAVLGVVAVFGILLGALVVPGWLMITFLRQGINNPRGVAVADQGLIVTRESVWNAMPRSIVVLLPMDALGAQIGATKSHVRLQLGAEQIWLRRNEYQILLTVAQPTIASMSYTAR
jgi:hypothetical protein